MDAVGGARGYGAFTGPVSGDGSASILRRASDASQPEIGKSETGGIEDGRGTASVRPETAIGGGVDVTDASVEALLFSRPIGNVGHHLDLKL